MTGCSPLRTDNRQMKGVTSALWPCHPTVPVTSGKRGLSKQPRDGGGRDSLRVSQQGAVAKSKKTQRQCNYHLLPTTYSSASVGRLISVVGRIRKNAQLASVDHPPSLKFLGTSTVPSNSRVLLKSWELVVDLHPLDCLNADWSELFPATPQPSDIVSESSQSVKYFLGIHDASV